MILDIKREKFSDFGNAAMKRAGISINVITLSIDSIHSIEDRDFHDSLMRIRIRFFPLLKEKIIDEIVFTESDGIVSIVYVANRVPNYKELIFLIENFNLFEIEETIMRGQKFTTVKIFTNGK